MSIVHCQLLKNQQINSLSQSDILYIGKLINRIEIDYANHPLQIQDCLWRIASNAELFPFEQFNPNGILTPQQSEQTWEFIQSFKNNLSEGIKCFIS